VGSFAAGDDAQVCGLVRQLATVGSFPEEGGELHGIGLPAPVAARDGRGRHPRRAGVPTR
jgi:hypothetical protein